MRWGASYVLHRPASSSKVSQSQSWTPIYNRYGSGAAWRERGGDLPPHDIATSMVFPGIQFGFGPDARARLAAVKVIDKRRGASSTPGVLHDLLRPPMWCDTGRTGDGRQVISLATGVTKRFRVGFPN